MELLQNTFVYSNWVILTLLFSIGLMIIAYANNKKRLQNVFLRLSCILFFLTSLQGYTLNKLEIKSSSLSIHQVISENKGNISTHVFFYKVIHYIINHTNN